MSWNYRVFCRNYEYGGSEFSIREAYYDADGNVEGWSADPSTPYGESRLEVGRDLALMIKAFDLPTIRITWSEERLADSDG